VGIEGFLVGASGGIFHKSFESAIKIAIFAPLSGVVPNPCSLGK
jgi:hypothetical protein